MSASASDLASAADLAMITPYNMPGKIYCYNNLTCSSSTPVCCDARADGGFSDTCVDSVATCTSSDPQAHAYQCGQAADCGTGMVCCGDIGTSKSGKMFLNGTTCEAACTSTQTQLCVSASECKSGTMCVGAALSGRDIGLCK